MNLLEALINSIRLPELRNKILFTGGILVVFRLFANIAIPEANKTALGLLFNQQALLGLLDLFSGGGLSRFSVVAMGMNPYINATIIMQLMTVISERITEYGIGNGVSLIIFAGIIGRGPQGIAAVFSAHSAGGGLADYVPFILFGGIALVMTAVIIEVQQAVRKIPIQSAQRVAGGREV